MNYITKSIHAFFIFDNSQWPATGRPSAAGLARVKRSPAGRGGLPLLDAARFPNEDDEDTSSSAEADEDERTKYNRIVNGEDASIDEIPYQVRPDKGVLLFSNKLRLKTFYLNASLPGEIFVDPSEHASAWSPIPTWVSEFLIYTWSPRLLFREAVNLTEVTQVSYIVNVSCFYIVILLKGRSKSRSKTKTHIFPIFIMKF